MSSCFTTTALRALWSALIWKLRSSSFRERGLLSVNNDADKGGRSSNIEYLLFLRKVGFLRMCELGMIANVGAIVTRSPCITALLQIGYRFGSSLHKEERRVSCKFSSSATSTRSKSDFCLLRLLFFLGGVEELKRSPYISILRLSKLLSLYFVSLQI